MEMLRDEGRADVLRSERTFLKSIGINQTNVLCPNALKEWMGAYGTWYSGLHLERSFMEMEPEDECFELYCSKVAKVDISINAARLWQVELAERPADSASALLDDVGARMVKMAATLAAHQKNGFELLQQQPRYAEQHFSVYYAKTLQYSAFRRAAADVRDNPVEETANSQALLIEMLKYNAFLDIGEE